MSINNPFEKLNLTRAEREPRAGEKLEGSRKKIWEKAKSILSGLGYDFGTDEGREKEEEIAGRLEEVEQMEKGGEYDDEGDNLFLETEIEYQGKPAQFLTVAQNDPNYDPAYKIDYAREMPDFQKHAERFIRREAIIGEKLPRFTEGRAVTADTIEQAETKAGNDIFLLKTVKESSLESEEFGYDEGRKLAETLLALQYDVKSSELVNEIMAEQGYKDQYELENEFSEDIFNDFNGYMDKSKAIMRDRLADGKLKKSQLKKIEKEMEKYRSIIESRQMGENEYSLVHNECYLDKLVVGEDGNVYLSDWKSVGTTQNRELSLINDLGQAFESARDSLDEENAEAFMQGAKDQLMEYYEKKFAATDKPENGREIAAAVINLAKLMVFQKI